MRWLLDTVTISEGRRRRRDPGLLSWLAEVNPLLTSISVVTVLEIERGVLLAERSDAQQAAVLRSWLSDSVLSEFDGRVLPFDLASAQICASLHVPNPRPKYDAMIAATALVHGLTVVTRNVKDFEPMGVKVFNPWVD